MKMKIKQNENADEKLGPDFLGTLGLLEHTHIKRDVLLNGLKKDVVVGIFLWIFLTIL